jgi:hypothetical protein
MMRSRSLIQPYVKVWGSSVVNLRLSFCPPWLDSMIGEDGYVAHDIRLSEFPGAWVFFAPKHRAKLKIVSHVTRKL